MRAVALPRHDTADPSSLFVDVEVPEPTPGARDLLVRVEAVSVNPVDTRMRAAAAGPRDEDRILGWDSAGVVEAVGAEASLFSVGDEVYYAGAINRPGCDSELHLVDERVVGRKPSNLSWGDAAALPLTTLAAWELLFDRFQIPLLGGRGDTILIINGAGGVGSMMTQLARRLTNLRVITTASRPESRSWSLDLGAHLVIDHHHNLRQQLRDAGIREVAFIASLSGSAQNLPQLPGIVAPQGRVGLLDDPDSFDITGFRTKSVSVSWEGMFTRSLFTTADMDRQHQILNDAARLVEDGTLRTTARQRWSGISSTSIAAAHEWVDSGRAIGKAVVEGW